MVCDGVANIVRDDRNNDIAATNIVQTRHSRCTHAHDTSAEGCLVLRFAALTFLVHFTHGFQLAAICA